MKPEEWRQVKELFEQARGITQSARAQFLAAQAPDPEVRREVESLLAVYDESPEFLEGSAPRLPEECTGPALAGSTVGSWRLLREIGRGGMGVVWEAERADGEYKHRVAVKLLQGGSFSRSGIARFREERRILALLEHPFIARLLDGGAARDGSPYLVMEYVEGQAVDAWCENRKPPLRERLGLFLEICAAVDYAHRRLVIHRDLKPANVLVTADGMPKLLDFGIARLLDPDESFAHTTHPTERILTPDFASPEQVRGEPASTASDIYSLGVLLYLMLTGRRPYPEDSQDPLAVLRAVLEQDPRPPSTAAGPAGKALRGGLDAIVLCALRKNPDQRYPSVRALAEDVRRWLDGRPVHAHPEPQWRRAAKFVRRNRMASLAAGLALVSLLGGGAISLWEAHTARRERDRAESSYREVRRFSRSVLFELNDAIRNLPGSTPARQLLATTATELLDNLAKKAGDSATLKVELAEAYRRLGHVQGSTFSDNLGMQEAAIQSFRKAVQLAEEAYAAVPPSSEAAGLLLAGYADLAAALLQNDEKQQADAVDAKLRDLLSRIERQPQVDERLRLSAATSFSALGYHRTQRSEFAAAKEDYRQAVNRFESLCESGVRLPDLRSQYVVALKRLGAIMIKEQSLEEAERLYRRALEVEDADLAEAPGDKRLAIDRTLTLSDLALILKRRKDLSGSGRIYEEVLRVRREALEADPRNQRLLYLTVSSELRLADIYSLTKRHEEAIELARTAVRRREQGHVQTFDGERNLAAARVSFSKFALAGAADAPQSLRRAWLAEAQSSLRQAEPFFARLGTENLSPFDSAARVDFLDAQNRLRQLSAPRRSLPQAGSR